MTITEIDLDNPNLLIIDNNSIKIKAINGLFLWISAITTDVTVSTDLLGEGNFRDVITMKAGEMYQSDGRIPFDTLLKFSGGNAEIKSFL